MFNNLVEKLQRYWQCKQRRCQLIGKLVQEHPRAVINHQTVSRPESRVSWHPLLPSFRLSIRSSDCDPEANLLVVDCGPRRVTERDNDAVTSQILRSPWNRHGEPQAALLQKWRVSVFRDYYFADKISSEKTVKWALCWYSVSVNMPGTQWATHKV